MQPSSRYQAELGNADEYAFRLARGPSIDALLPPGTIVRTNYGTGPYAVLKVSQVDGQRIPGQQDCYPAHWSLDLVHLLRWADRRGKVPKPDSWINEVVPVDGRLLKLFEANDDEVFIVGFHENIGRLLAPKPVQLDLF